MRKKTEYLWQIICAILVGIYFIFIQGVSSYNSSFAGLAIGISIGLLLNQKVGFIKRRKLDEREYQFFYKSNSISYSLILLSAAIIEVLSNNLKRNSFFAENWFESLIIISLLLNGIVGFIIFSKK